ncbi:hypothetical protein K469DRAFT_719698 [Zopfia rhizophila CBS 207.26]|uniref:Uncharacterized protein n=1 Tax=Zopfia rhizophila CBS 207.26 TaxID=1314779 RepID=A0A6A6DEN9_9PEZI|nr:hypothetical protein K469DRAFT_719698 [Zopfia rhizophila CBS 207.26]
MAQRVLSLTRLSTSSLPVWMRNYVAARNTNPSAGEHLSVLGLENWPDEPSTFLVNRATETEITELEQRLARPESNADDPNDADPTAGCLILLPDGYKVCLKTGNGFTLRIPRARLESSMMLRA